MRTHWLFALSFLGSTVGPVASISLDGLNHFGNGGLETVEIVAKYSYPVESHFIESEDGYITTLHRIPHNGSDTSKKRPVIFLQHGLDCSDNIFIILGPSKSLGFLLADRGYDVWMGNARGSRYSKKHIRYSTKDSRYWDFSFHEMGYFDLPKAIDYILAQTKEEKLIYLGHSMGNAIIMVLLSTRPEYNDKVKFVFSLAPAVFVGNTASVPLLFLLKENAAVLKLKGPSEGFPPDLNEVLPGYWKACDPLLPTTAICREIYTTFGGPSTSIAQSSFPEIYSIFPTTSSNKVYDHYNKNRIKGTFAMYDYGPVKNSIIYKSIEAPDYNFTLVTTRVLIFYSDVDLAVQPEDAFLLKRSLSNVDIYRVPEHEYSHLDYIFGDTNLQHVYKEIFRVLDGL